MTLVIVVIVLLALIFLGVSRAQASKNKAAAQWPTTQGRILSSEIFRTRDESGPSDEPLVTYEYSAEGKTYRSTRVKFGFKPKTHPTLQKYPAGAVVPVFYNPANPSEAVLER